MSPDVAQAISQFLCHLARRKVCEHVTVLCLSQLVPLSDTVQHTAWPQSASIQHRALTQPMTMLSKLWFGPCRTPERKGPKQLEKARSRELAMPAKLRK